MGADGVWVSPQSAQREKWDNSPQLIHCTLKTHYSLRRTQKEKKTCSPRWKEILCLRWRPWHKLPGFPHVWNFFYAQFSGFDSSSLLTRSFVYEPGGGHPQLPRTPTNTPTSEPHARTEYTMNTQLLHLNKQNSAALKQHTSKAQPNTMCTFSGNHWFPFISVWHKN